MFKILEQNVRKTLQYTYVIATRLPHEYFSFMACNGNEQERIPVGCVPPAWKPYVLQ